MEQNSELKWICDLLTDNGLEFWLDSGTLLRLVREGEILKGDGDIDLGIWAAYEPLLKNIYPSIEKNGYKIYVTTYRGLNFKYRFVPLAENGGLEIDVNLFRKCGNWAWCPQVYRVESPFAKKNPLYYIYGLPRYIIQMLYGKKRQVEVNRWPWSVTYKVYCWWVPSSYYEHLKNWCYRYPVPRDSEDYLKFRYGRWQVPDRNWSFFTDDGAIKYLKPEMLVKEPIWHCAAGDKN